jgi:putative two-component system response regulator
MNDISLDINRALKASTILVVDDEEANVKLIRKILKNDGFNSVISTQSPYEAIELFNKNKIDLILLDLNMPDLDGYAVLDIINQSGSKLPPTLIITAQYFQENRQLAFDKGARDYVTKPFDTLELVSRIKILLEVQITKGELISQNKVLEQRVIERTQQIYESRLKIVRHLGRAAEYRDNETGMHIVRMSKISCLLGREAGMSVHDCNLLLNASPMHDIGKIGIPDSILLKPGKFTPEEWEIMKTHVEIGADILSGDNSEILTMAHSIALTHHEKFDGSGYPNGLVGESIPLVGRISAIADVFDALTSVRPYKKAWSVKSAVELIESERGRHFDPKLVDLFIQFLPEIITIRIEHSDE